MALNSQHDLSPSTVLAIEDLIGGSEIPRVEESAIWRMALGTADEPTRIEVARACVASPDVRGKLANLRRLANQRFSGVEGEALRAFWGRVTVFRGWFTAEDVRAIFPAESDALFRLRQLSLDDLVESLEGADEHFQVPEVIRQALGTAADEWEKPYVALQVQKAERIHHLIAEGRWEDGSARLYRSLPDLQQGWNLADLSSEFGDVLHFVDLLAGTLMEIGDWDRLTDLARVGYRAADALGRPKLRSRLLSFEGVSAARRDRPELARRLWTERVDLNRRIGNPVGESDALLDLAFQALGRQEMDLWGSYIEQAERSVAASGNADLRAALMNVHVLERIAAGDMETAANLAQRAVNTLTGESGSDIGLHVRGVLAQALIRTNQRNSAIEVICDVLDRAVEGGRYATVSAVLRELATLLEEENQVGLAARSLATGYSINRSLGSRHAAEFRDQLEAFRGRHAGNPELLDLLLHQPDDWSASVKAILEEIRQSGPAVAAR